MQIRVIIVIFIVLFFPLRVFSQNDPELEIHEDWRIKKEDEGIIIYERWIQAEADRKARQYRIEMEVEGSLSAVIATLKDEEGAKDWMNHTREYYLFDEKDDFNWYSYTEMSIPWPLRNQDLVTRNQLVQDPATKFIKINITGAPNYIPHKKEADRMAHFEGSWDLTPISRSRTKLAYTLFTGQKPVLPRWMVDPIIEYGLLKTYAGMREAISEKARTGVSLGYIKDW